MLSMGASGKLIRSIFTINGMMISLSGALFGIVIGAILIWLQEKYGLISLGDNDQFLLVAFPVKLKLLDFIYFSKK